tara:strand:- start:291 stop:452 length:162 start_codon:yes stop_codon:yes gene_type:complete
MLYDRQVDIPETVERLLPEAKSNRVTNYQRTNQNCAGYNCPQQCAQMGSRMMA